MIPFKGNVQNRQIWTESKLGVSRAWGRGTLGLTADWYRVSFGGNRNVLELDRGNGYTTLKILYYLV